MKDNTRKIFKTAIIGLTVLSLCAAPALQAVQVSKSVESMQKTCSCCCCVSINHEHNEVDHGLAKSDRCGCQVGQSLPINATPIISNISPDDQIQTATVNSFKSGSLFENKDCDDQFVDIDCLPQKHPPLFILNASFLI